MMLSLLLLAQSIEPSGAANSTLNAQCVAEVKDLKIIAVTLGKSPSEYVSSNLSGGCKALGFPKAEDAAIPALPQGLDPSQVIDVSGSWPTPPLLSVKGHFVYPFVGGWIPCSGDCSDSISPPFPSNLQFCKVASWEGGVNGVATLTLRPEKVAAVPGGAYYAPISIRFIKKGDKGQRVDIDKLTVWTVPPNYSPSVRDELGCWKGGHKDNILVIKDPSYVPTAAKSEQKAIPKPLKWYDGIDKSNPNAWVVKPNFDFIVRTYLGCSNHSATQVMKVPAGANLLLLPNQRHEVAQASPWGGDPAYSYATEWDRCT